MIGREEKSRAGDTSRSDFEELFESRLKELQEGDITKGRVVQITQDSVMIDIGYKSEGQVPLREFLDKDGQPTIKVGDEVAVLIERREDENGIVRLSKAKADHFKVWDRIVEACEKGEPMEGTISQRIKGGFYAEIEGVTAFLPGSQVDLKPVRNPDKLIGQKFKFRILKYNRRKNNVIVSRRVLLEEERESLRKTTLETLAEGAIIRGNSKEHNRLRRLH
ncbi:MAG: S1 RNA-binding domain-containing protein [Deltaproteobacteria bacterium]|nr:S1 RNA-binding domain-containing protein [Deltaproteobacteria bacterium]